MNFTAYFTCYKLTNFELCLGILKKDSSLYIVIMVYEEVRNYVWQDYLDVARLVRYYQALSSQYHRKHNLMRILVLLPAVSSAGVLFESFPAILGAILGVTVAAVVVCDFVLDYGRKAYVLSAIYAECSELESEWSELWERTNSGEFEGSEIRAMNSDLSKRLNSVTSRAINAGIRVDDRINKECTESAYKIMEERYASAT